MPIFKKHISRFTGAVTSDSVAPDLFHGCPVVSASGSPIGKVERLLIDSKTKRLRYVVSKAEQSDGVVCIPWQALYFDSANSQLVFYTFAN